ncbi:MAG: hypothetical protein AAGJ10_13875 [Bacteroidota bacterium]
MGKGINWLPPPRELTMAEQLRITRKLRRVQESISVFDQRSETQRDLDDVQMMLDAVRRGYLHARDIATIHALLSVYTPDAVGQ